MLAEIRGSKAPTATARRVEPVELVERLLLDAVVTSMLSLPIRVFDVVA